MAKYRIVKRWYHRPFEFRYLLQRKILGLLWWTVDSHYFLENAVDNYKLHTKVLPPDEVITNYGT